MGRRSHTRSLAVWMNGELVGHWRLPTGGGQEFAYADGWLTSDSVRPLSLSLPLRPAATPHRAGVAAFFENLLPDNAAIRQRMQRRFAAESSDAFDLLEEAGRDCIGAVQLLKVGEQANVRQITGELITDEGIAALLSGTIGDKWAQQNREDFRISLAGAQEKTALLWHNNAWHKPTGATPTTHLFKLPIGVAAQGIDLSTSVENEWICAQIVRAYGLSVAACEMRRYGDFKTLVVERFDRKPAVDGNWWLRLPQEDFCQATGTSPGKKYENDGGPGIGTIMDLLLGSTRAESDRRDFMKAQAIFWLLAAIDGHAKNFSIFLEPGGRFRLTPLYDILSAYPVLGHGRSLLSPQRIKMAMALRGKNRHYEWSSIRVRHFIETAKRSGLADMQNILGELVETTPTVIAAVRKKVPAGFLPEIADSILEGLEKSAQVMGAELMSA